MRVLHLTLKKKWFDMIASGEKKEEYREIKKYWNARLNKEYDVVEFRNGYAKDSPRIRFELLSVLIGHGRKEWGADPYERYYILKLGNIVNA